MADPFIQTHNLAELSALDEHALLTALRQRYGSDLVYTYVGEILIATNPFRPLPIYGPLAVARYKTGQAKGECPEQEVPHVFAVARRAYEDMLATQRAQVCVISGESGAGKTESCKFLVRQLMEMSRSAASNSPGLEAKIIEVNPLLEAFGNAQTVMNNNSSRFGKYISLLFESSNGAVAGATINQYLLEKSRVATQSEREKNFHVFYYIFAGLPQDLLKRVNLRRPSQHRYLSADKDADRYCSTELCREGFLRMRECMEAVEISYEHALEIFQLLAGVILIGDIEFGKDDAAFVSPSNARVVDCARTLGLDPPALCRALTVSTNVARGEIISISYSPEKAGDCRDATAKAIYGRLFNYIVSFVNGVLAPDHGTSVRKIGILDIFGFENFEYNSFEQFCINLANEQLQYFFNEHIFRMEKEELRKEGVRSVNIDYKDNTPVLQLFLAKSIGLLPILDEQTQFPKGNDTTCEAKFNEQYRKSLIYAARRGPQSGFSIKHYAGEVTYQIFGFVEKNRDTLPENILDLFKNSRFNLVRDLFLDESLGKPSTLVRRRQVSVHLARSSSKYGHHTGRKKNRTAPPSQAGLNQGQGNRKNKRTVSSQFKLSLEQLMKKLNTAEPHFIRCIKPNREKRAQRFDDSYVLEQLRYTGVLETVRIRQEGFAYRPTFSEFLQSYCCIGFAFSAKVKPTAGNCAHVLEQAAVTGWQVGREKVFLKYYHVDQLRQTLIEQHRHATAIQKVWRGFLERKRYERLRRRGLQDRDRIRTFCELISSRSEALAVRQYKLHGADVARHKAEREKLAAAILEKNQPNTRYGLSKANDWTMEYEATLSGSDAVYEVAASYQKPNELFASASPGQRKAQYQRTEQHADTPYREVAEQRTPPRHRKYIGAAGQPVHLPYTKTSPSVSSKVFSKTRSPKSGAGSPRAPPRKGVNSELAMAKQHSQSALSADRDDRPPWTLGANGFLESPRPASVSPALGIDGMRTWFYGQISRRKADDLLEDREDGTFLVRASETRFGYSCSVVWGGFVRHFMVERLPGNKCRIMGMQRIFVDLADFVEYHGTIPITAEGVLLLHSCGVGKSLSDVEVAMRGMCGVVGYRGRGGWSRKTSAGALRQPGLQRKVSTRRHASVIRRPSVAKNGKPMKYMEEEMKEKKKKKKKRLLW